MNKNESDTFTVSDKVKDWHSPRSEKCPHNRDAALPCNCKRPRRRKHYRVVRVNDESVPHGVRSRLAVEIYPDGTIVLREIGRRRVNALSTTTGKIMIGLLWRQAMVAAKAKKAKRRRS